MIPNTFSHISSAGLCKKWEAIWRSGIGSEQWNVLQLKCLTLSYVCNWKFPNAFSWWSFSGQGCRNVITHCPMGDLNGILDKLFWSWFCLSMFELFLLKLSPSPPQRMNAIRSYWSTLPSGNKPLTEPILTQIYVTFCRHLAAISHVLTQCRLYAIRRHDWIG